MVGPAGQPQPLQDAADAEQLLDDFVAALAELTKSSESIHRAATLGMQASGGQRCRLLLHLDQLLECGLTLLPLMQN